jgi:hypothetical protein
LRTSTARLVSLSRSLQRNAMIESLIVARYTAVACSLSSRAGSVVVVRERASQQAPCPTPNSQNALDGVTGKRNSAALFCMSLQAGAPAPNASRGAFVGAKRKQERHECRDRV